MAISELFWNASVEELKRGYICKNDQYICLLCGKSFEDGIIYQEGDTFYEAKKYVQIHLAKKHGSVFTHLIQLDKKLTGLSDHQNSLLRLFFQGKSDGEVQKEMGIGSTSTIRNHRFILKEKERQAKIFLVLMDLLKEKDKYAPNFVPVHTSAAMLDERYNITADEHEKIIKKYFPQGADGQLASFSLIKEKYKLVVLTEIAKRFDMDRFYHEKEVNQILQPIYDDYVTLRRYLIDYGFLDRKADGSQYWRKG